MKKIIVLKGLPGSGKSYYARLWVDRDPEHRVRFNRDDIRNMLGKYWVPNRENLINSMYWEFLNQATNDGYDIIIDNMNLNEKYVEEIREFVKETNEWLDKSALDYKYEIEVKTFFDIPLELCIERDAKRENPIGEEVIRIIYNKYKDIITQCHPTI